MIYAMLIINRREAGPICSKPCTYIIQTAQGPLSGTCDPIPFSTERSSPP